MRDVVNDSGGGRPPVSFSAKIERVLLRTVAVSAVTKAAALHLVQAYVLLISHPCSMHFAVLRSCLWVVQTVRRRADGGTRLLFQCLVARYVCLLMVCLSFCVVKML